MPSRIVRLVFVLAVLSFMGPFAPGRATAEPTAEQRAAWVRKVKLEYARRIAQEGLEERHERNEAIAEAVERRLALRAEAARLDSSRRSGSDTGASLRLDVADVVSLSARRPAGAEAEARGDSRSRGGLRQRPAAEGSNREDRRDAAARRTGAAHPRPSTSAVQGFAPNVRVSDPALDDPQHADTQSETSVAAWRNYVLVAWNEGRATGHSPIGYAYSTNSGQSFVQGGWPNEGANDVFWYSDPVVTVNEKTGEFYFCALADPIDIGGISHGVGVMRGTFSGSNFSWDAPHVANSAPEGFPLFQTIDKPWIAVDSLGGNLYLTYTMFSGGGDSIYVQRSTNKGLSWQQPPFPIAGRADMPLMQGSRTAVGPDGEAYVVWKEIQPTQDEDAFRIRKSTNQGLTWGAPNDAVTLMDNFGSGAPGFNRQLGISFPSIGIDRTNGPRRGRVYLTWNESVNFWDSTPELAPTATPETEPNDSPGTATSFDPGAGQTLTGRFGNADDFDYWKFTATAGETFVFYSDVVAVTYTMRVFCTDGETRLAFSGDRFGSPPGFGLIVWTAPKNGDYFLRMVTFDGDTGSYRVLTSKDLPVRPQRGRDARDVFVRSSPDGISWTGNPVAVNTDAIGYDNWLPEIVVAGERLYAAWYDFSGADPATCGGESHVNLARSDDGGQTWLQLGPITDQVTAWTRVNSILEPNQGDYIAVFANPAVVYPVWADGRCSGAGCLSTPDVMTAPFLVNGLQIAVANVVVDTGHVAITWQVTGPGIVSARVERRVGSGAFAQVGTVLPNAQDQLFYDDTDVTPSTQYQYRLGVDVNGTEVFLGERTVQVPGIPAPALAFEGVRPNPTPGPLTVAFSLPTTERASLTLFDATGRKRREWDVSSLGAGPHVFDFGAGLSIEPGVYLIRLRQGSAEQTRRVSVIP